MIIFRMPFPALISVVVGVSALIPIFGAFFGIGIGALFVLVSKPSMTIWFIVFLLVLQQIETNFIYPRVIGKYVGLPAVWVLLSVTVGSSFGVVGILLSVPLFSVIYCLLGRFADERLKGAEKSVNHTDVR
jgi:predicted PurR-regulated permease PerM